MSLMTLNRNICPIQRLDVLLLYSSFSDVGVDTAHLIDDMRNFKPH